MDENTPKSRDIESYRIGEGLYGLSLFELEARIEAYNAEIIRLRHELAKKSDEKQAADALFRKN